MSFLDLSPLFLYIQIGNCQLQVNADVRVVPQWSFPSSCRLYTWNVVKNRSNWVFTAGDSATICSIQIETSLEFGIHVQIPQLMPPVSFMYVEKLGDLLDCQNKYVVITADEPCDTFFSNSKFKLHLIGNTGVKISDISMNQSPADCLISITEYPEMSDIHVCTTKEFNFSISCATFSNGICSLELLSVMLCSEIAT